MVYVQTSVEQILQVADIADTDISVLDIGQYWSNTDIWEFCILTMDYWGTVTKCLLFWWGEILEFVFKNTQIVYHFMIYRALSIGQAVSAFKANFTNTDTG